MFTGGKKKADPDGNETGKRFCPDVPKVCEKSSSSSLFDARSREKLLLEPRGREKGGLPTRQEIRRQRR